MAKKLTEHYPDGYVEWYSIHEVFYDKKGKVNGIAETPATIFCEENFRKKEMVWVLNAMKKCLSKPIIDFNTSKEIK